MPVTPVTPKQKQVLEAILTYTQQHKYPPSIQDICDMLHLKSPSTVHDYLKKLKLYGLISWEPGLTRTLKVLNYEEVRS